MKANANTNDFNGERTRIIKAIRYDLDENMREIGTQEIVFHYPYDTYGFARYDETGFASANHYIESLLAVMGIKAKRNTNLSLAECEFAYDLPLEQGNGYVIIRAM